METHRPELIHLSDRYDADRDRAAAGRLARGPRPRSRLARLAAYVRLHLGRRKPGRAPAGTVKEDPELVA